MELNKSYKAVLAENELAQYANPAGYLDSDAIPSSGGSSLPGVYIYFDLELPESDTETTSLDLSFITAIVENGDLFLGPFPVLTNLDLSNLTEVRRLTLFKCNSLVELNLSSLVTCSGKIDTQGYSVLLETVSLPVLTTAPDLIIQGVALTEETVNSLLILMLANGKTAGTIDLSGGTSAAPTGAGATAAADLVTAGVTVTTN